MNLPLLMVFLFFMTLACRSDNETIALIRNTISERDSTQDCIIIGSAAVVAHFFDINQPCPVGCEDVDALCSKKFFDAELANLQNRPGVSKVQVRWPKGRLALRGATNLTLDIFPEKGEALLPFTVAHDMSDAWVPETYEGAKESAVYRSGIVCKPLGAILLQIAQIGRDKDIKNAIQISPQAAAVGFITPAQFTAVNAELEKTLRDRKLHPERYYAHIPI